MHLAKPVPVESAVERVKGRRQRARVRVAVPHLQAQAQQRLVVLEPQVVVFPAILE